MAGPSVAAFLAVLSAASLPWMPSWPGTHLTLIEHHGNLRLILNIALRNSSTMRCPGLVWRSLWLVCSLAACVYGYFLDPSLLSEQLSAQIQSKPVHLHIPCDPSDPPTCTVVCLCTFPLVDYCSCPTLPSSRIHQSRCGYLICLGPLRKSRFAIWCNSGCDWTNPMGGMSDWADWLNRGGVYWVGMHDFVKGKRGACAVCVLLLVDMGVKWVGFR